MDSREGAKEVVRFAKKQWKQNRPKSVEARRVKDKNVIKFGFPPFVLTAKAPVKFVVCVEYTDTTTIFQFSGAGQLLGSKIFENSIEVKTEIIKKSKLIDKFPRKHPSRA